MSVCLFNDSRVTLWDKDR